MSQEVKSKHYITDNASIRVGGRRAVDEVDMLQRCHNEIDQTRRFELVGVRKAAEYLNVSRRTLHRWHDRGILKAVIDSRNNRKQYMYTHLWVFKRLWLNKDDDEENTA